MQRVTEGISIVGNDTKTQGRRGALVIVVFFGVAAVYVLLLGTAFSWAYVSYISAAVFGTGLVLASFLVFASMERGDGQVERVINWYAPVEPTNYVDADVTPPTRELPAHTLPALPADDGVIQYNHFSRGGEQIPRKLFHGFDMRDLEWLARYLANGNKFTEAAMEKLILPYSLDVLGKADAGTLYTKFMELCTLSGVIVGREAKKSGTLAVTEFAEILQKIKSVPEV